MSHNTKKLHFLWVILVMAGGFGLWVFASGQGKVGFDANQRPIVEQINDEQSKSLSLEGFVISLAEAVLHAMLPSRG